MKHLLKFENYGKIPVAYYLHNYNVPKTVTINGGNKWQYDNNDDVWTNLGPTNEYDGIYTFAYWNKDLIYQCGQQEIMHFGGDIFGPSGDTPPYENNLYGLMWLYDNNDNNDEYYIEISEVSDNMISGLPISITISDFTSDNANIIVPDGTIFYRFVEKDIVYKYGSISIVQIFFPGYNEDVSVITNDNTIVTASFNAKFNYIELNSPFVVLLKDSLPMSFEVTPTRSTNGNIVYEYIGKNNKNSKGNTINWFYVYYNQANNDYRILNDRTTLPSGATNVTYGGYTFHYCDGEGNDKYTYYPDPLTDHARPTLV